jgi:hypothetical protein
MRLASASAVKGVPHQNAMGAAMNRALVQVQSACAVGFVVFLCFVFCVPALAGSGQSGITGSKFSICNKTPWTIYAAIAWSGNSWSDSGLNSMGWIRFKPGECQRLYPLTSTDRHRWIFARAFDADGEIVETWAGGGSPACIDPDSIFVFRANEQFDCPERKTFAVFGDTDMSLERE